MGAVSSVPNDGSTLHIKDQTRFSVVAVSVTNSRGQTVLRVAPNAFPATRYTVQRGDGDEGMVEWVQDPETLVNALPPAFLVRLVNTDDLTFTFTFIIRPPSHTSGIQSSGTAPLAGGDTTIAGLTYVSTSTPAELSNLINREFHSDPNLHKNPAVQLLGDYTTAQAQSGSNPAKPGSSVTFDYVWKYRPPKPTEDRGGGWRSSAAFVEYDQRAHRLDVLASFSFWVQNAPATPVQQPQRLLSVPRSPRSEMGHGLTPPRLRVPSAQSIESRFSSVSDSEGEGSYKDYDGPASPIFEAIPEDGLGLVPAMTEASLPPATPSGSLTTPVTAPKVDLAATKSLGDDPVANDDGPVFRATMRSLEQRTASMRVRMKKVLRTAEAAEAAQQACNVAVADFTDALQSAAQHNSAAVKPALEHYFSNIAREIAAYNLQTTRDLRKLVIEPVARLYQGEIKAAEGRRREFEEESKEYYAFVSKYLGQRSESLKEKKVAKSDEKYQSKRRTFELKRFDYSSFMHDLHGGRKDQEVLSQLTRYADAQARGFLGAAKKIEGMMPQLDALVGGVRTADQEFQMRRREREEKRRALESSGSTREDGAGASGNGLSELARRPSQSLMGGLAQSPPGTGVMAPISLVNGKPPQASNGGGGMANSITSPNSRFKGIRDLEDPTSVPANAAAPQNVGTQRKEGLLWALSRPTTTHPSSDPAKSLNLKPGWHKFWIVLDGGRLSEYVNWKERLDLHMEPIDLRMASVREARGSGVGGGGSTGGGTGGRRFCFEVLTPGFTRVYQATAEGEMREWIDAVSNALQSAFETRGRDPPISSPSPSPQGEMASGGRRKEIKDALTGKSSSFSGHRQVSNPNRGEAAKAVGRYATTGNASADRSTKRAMELEAEPSALLQRIRAAESANNLCADCGSNVKVDWCSINLGVLICIECSGIHRSLGTHISKVRSLTLDTSAFTPDIIDLLLLVGNKVSNAIWEARLDAFLKPSPQSTREQRLHFITAKYSERLYVQVPIHLGGQGADELLLTSIKRNTLIDVLQALALKANPNALDRSRSTHAVFLALAAADPAMPGSMAGGFSHGRTVSSTSTITTSNGRPTTPSQMPRKSFPVAELLLQNGADIPTEPAPIPLSAAARSYLDFKTEQRLGRVPATSSGEPVMTSGAGLPSIREHSSKRSSARMSGMVEGLVKRPCRHIRTRSLELIVPLRRSRSIRSIRERLRRGGDRDERSVLTLDGVAEDLPSEPQLLLVPLRPRERTAWVEWAWKRGARAETAPSRLERAIVEDKAASEA